MSNPSQHVQRLVKDSSMDHSLPSRSSISNAVYGSNNSSAQVSSSSFSFSSHSNNTYPSNAASTTTTVSSSGGPTATVNYGYHYPPSQSSSGSMTNTNVMNNYGSNTVILPRRSYASTVTKYPSTVNTAISSSIHSRGSTSFFSNPATNPSHSVVGGGGGTTTLQHTKGLINNTVASVPTILPHHTLSHNTVVNNQHHQPVHIDKPDKPLRARTTTTTTTIPPTTTSTTTMIIGTSDTNGNNTPTSILDHQPYDMSSMYHSSILSSSSSGSGTIPLLAAHRTMMMDNNNPVTRSTITTTDYDLSLSSLMNEKEQHLSHHNNPHLPYPRSHPSSSLSPNNTDNNSIFYPTNTGIFRSNAMQEAIAAATVVRDSIAQLHNKRQGNSNSETMDETSNNSNNKGMTTNSIDNATNVLSNLSLSQLANSSVVNNRTNNNNNNSTTTNITTKLPPLSILEQLSIGLVHTDTEFISSSSSSSSTVDPIHKQQQRVNRQRKRNPFASLLPEFTDHNIVNNADTTNNDSRVPPPSSVSSTVPSSTTSSMVSFSSPSTTTVSLPTPTDDKFPIASPRVPLHNANDNDDSNQYTLPASFLSPAQLAANQQSRLNRIHQQPQQSIPSLPINESESVTVSTLSSARSSPLSSTASSSPGIDNSSLHHENSITVSSPGKVLVPRPPPPSTKGTNTTLGGGSALLPRPPPPRNTGSSAVSLSIVEETNMLTHPSITSSSLVIPSSSIAPTNDTNQALSAHLSFVVAHQTKLENELKVTQARLAMYEPSLSSSASSSSSSVVTSPVSNPFHNLSSSPSPSSPPVGAAYTDSASNVPTVGGTITNVPIGNESTQTMDELARLTDELNMEEKSPLVNRSLQSSTSRTTTPLSSGNTTLPPVATTTAFPTANSLLKVSSRLPSVALSPQARTISAHVVHRLQSQVTSLTKQLQEITKDNETEKHKVMELSKEKHSLYEELLTEQQRVQQISVAMEQTKTVMEEYTKTVRQLEEEKVFLQQRLQDLETSIHTDKMIFRTEQDRLQSIINAQEQQNQELEEQKKTLLKNERTLTEQLQHREHEWQSSRSVSTSEVQELKQRLTETKEAYDVLEIRYRETEQRNQQLTVQQEVLLQKGADLQNHVSSLQSKENHLQQQIIEINTYHTEQLTVAESTARTERIRCEEIADELTETKQEMEALRIRVGEITRSRQQEQETFHQQLQTLSNELTITRDTLNSKGSALDDVTAKLLVYESGNGVKVTKEEAEQFHEWQISFPRLQNEYTLLQDALKEKENIVQGLKDEIQTIRTSKDEIIKDKINLESTIITLRKRIQTLEQNFENERKDYETKHQENKLAMEKIHMMYGARIEDLETQHRTDVTEKETHFAEEMNRLRNELASVQETLGRKVEELQHTQVDDRDTISELMGALDAAKVRRNEWERRGLGAEDKVRELQAVHERESKDKDTLQQEISKNKTEYAAEIANLHQTHHQAMEEYETKLGQYRQITEQYKETLSDKETIIRELQTRVDALSTVTVATPPRKTVLPQEIQTSPLPQTTYFSSQSTAEAAVHAIEEIPRLEAIILSLKTEILDLHHMQDTEKTLRIAAEVARNETLTKLEQTESAEKSSRAAQQAAAETLRAVTMEYENQLNALRDSLNQKPVMSLAKESVSSSSSSELGTLQSRLDSALAFSDSLRKKLDDKERMLSTAASVADKAAAAAEVAEATVDYAYSTAQKQIDMLRQYYDNKLSTVGITVSETEIQQILQEAIQSVPSLGSIDFHTTTVRTPYFSSVVRSGQRFFTDDYPNETNRSMNNLSMLSGISGDPRTPMDTNMHSDSVSSSTIEDHLSLSQTLPTPMNHGTSNGRHIPLSTESNGTARYGYGFHHHYHQTPTNGSDSGNNPVLSSTTSSQNRLTSTVRSLGDTITSFAVTPASVGNHTGMVSYSTEKINGNGSSNNNSCSSSTSLSSKPIFVSPVTPITMIPYDTRSGPTDGLLGTNHPIVTVSDTGTTPLDPSSPLLSYQKSNRNIGVYVSNILSPESPPNLSVHHRSTLQKSSTTPLPPSPKHRGASTNIHPPIVTELRFNENINESVTKETNISGGGTGETESTTVLPDPLLVATTVALNVSNRSILLESFSSSSPPDSPGTSSTVSSLPSSPILSSLIYGTYSRINELELPTNNPNYRNEFASPSTPSRTSVIYGGGSGDNNDGTTNANRGLSPSVIDFTHSNYLTLEALAAATLSSSPPSSSVSTVLSRPSSTTVPVLVSPPVQHTHKPVTYTHSMKNNNTNSSIDNISSLSSVLVSPTTAMDNILTLANTAQLDSTETAKLLQAILGLQSPPPSSSTTVTSRSDTEAIAPAIMMSASNITTGSSSTNGKKHNPSSSRGLESPPSPVTYPANTHTSRTFAAALVNQSIAPSSSQSYRTGPSPHRRTLYHVSGNGSNAVPTSTATTTTRAVRFADEVNK